MSRYGDRDGGRGDYGSDRYGERRYTGGDRRYGERRDRYGGGGDRDRFGGGRRRGIGRGGAAGFAARIGTEDDRENCPFYYKIGACRHGERCARRHLKPATSQTILVPHMYRAPPQQPGAAPPNDTEQFENFYEDVMEEVSKYGVIEEINVLENVCDHLVGNTYITYRTEEEGEKCCQALRQRWFNFQCLAPEFSLVTNFRMARCRLYDEGKCKYGGNCNYMHIRRTSRYLQKRLRKLRKKAEDRDRSRSRSRGRRRRRSRSRSRGRRRGDDNDVARASNSEERRNAIAQWAKQKEGGPEGPEAVAAPTAPDSGAPAGGAPPLAV